ncbi:hypothetical protein [Pantoea sp. 18069]|uniref:hypothetical protein n=1 Tax=Pantoea sp. 18069 TaxID=2681415 RepID=UPI0013597630|nr:hypothetical protein [Pantoea sp. 18069]
MVSIQDSAMKTCPRMNAAHSPASRSGKSGLNRCILDQGGQVQAAVGAQDERERRPCCPCRGHVAPENRRTQQQFRCVAYGHADDCNFTFSQETAFFVK